MGKRRQTGATVRIPAGPRCTRCGHPACPCCVTNGAGWCDVVTPEIELCCDGECTYDDPAALRAWEKKIRPRIDRAFRTGAHITIVEERAPEASTPPGPPPPGGSSPT